MIKHSKFLCIFSIILFSATFLSCNKKNQNSLSEKETREQYMRMLNTPLDSQSRFKVINKLATYELDSENYQELILLLTDWVEKNPDDLYNSYWLLMTAHAYLSLNSEPIAEYYFDRILQTCPDLILKNNVSVHFLCLQNLIQISKTSSHRIKYFNELITRFPDQINTTELYLRLALEYEKDNQWEQALNTFELFVKQPDATTIQIPGEPDAYKEARRLIDFNKSSKNWTFESLSDLEANIRKAINNYDFYALDRLRAKVNFFTMSWKQDEMAENEKEFSMANYMTGNTIYCNNHLDSDSTSNEAYLKTWGWSNYVSVWYFYFRKVDFPLNPEINGNWEWAGIYIGNKL